MTSLSLKNPHVLLIDDDQVLAALLTAKLQSRGIDVSVANDGASAAAKLGHETPDLILLDVMMPMISGHEFLRLLKEDPKLEEIPVVMISASKHKIDKSNALSIGARDFILKPFDPDVVADQIETWLAEGL